MTKLIFTLIVTGIMSMPVHAKSFELSLPYIVGPDIYELYTDAGLLITKVYVNGIERKLSNPEGQGFTVVNRASFSGPMGYYNKVILNSHMRKGKNEIKVVFQPSPVINKNMMTYFEDKIFAHAVIVRGVLKKNSLGVSTEKLDKLVSEHKAPVTILANKFLKGMPKDNKNITMNFIINTADGEREYKGQIDYCDGGISSSYNFTGELLLNNTAILKIHNNASTTLVPLNKILKPIDVELKLKVSSINNNEPAHFKYSIECDMKSIIKNKLNLKPKYNNVSFGDFFDRLDTEIWNLKFSKPGIYQHTFQYYY